MSDRLALVAPALVVIVVQIQIRMAALGLPMIVTDGARTEAEQAALYAQGRTAPGRIVTYASGRSTRQGGTGLSRHQITEDGFGHAVDMTFVVQGVPSWADRLPWPIYGATAISLGAEWGGSWPAPKTDRPHIQLKGAA